MPLDSSAEFGGSEQEEQSTNEEVKKVMVLEAATLSMRSVTSIVVVFSTGRTRTRKQ